jgi:hypothetical protein
MKTPSLSTALISAAAFIGLGVLCVAPQHARADAWNQRTIFTFSGPVEIPGQVLPAGTYVFQLADTASDRDIVQVFNKDQTHLYGTFLTIPDERLKPAEKPVIMFAERPANAPEAVKAWFYPGDTYGHEFVYPKSEAAKLAKANKQAVPSMPDELGAQTTKPAKTMKESSVTALKNAHITAEQPNGTEGNATDVFQAPAAHKHQPAGK